MQNSLLSKIVSFNQLEQQCLALKQQHKKIVFTNGCFDLLHAGHIDLLFKAALQGDVLVIGVNTDNSIKRLKGAKRPIINQHDRAIQLAALSCVSLVCLFDEDTPLNLIQAITPDVLIKGGDYTISTIVGAEWVQVHGGTVATIPLLEGYSTSSIIQKIIALG
ncbi:MAG: D-glycero-beta-D-manno-heptose 1-phosphate adenylyltransferase [Chitinophagia bacterium]|nr:D-glycero-beta-D-manno-heptose 1-phosphate adenylyltransferase [Chitinophagia bacterium]